MNRIDINDEDRDYLLMFIHLSDMPNIYKFGELINGVIEVEHIIEKKKGYIFKTNNKDYYVHYNDENMIFGSG